jgi:glycosyltransferase involved in cell wall biosynthesis
VTGLIVNEWIEPFGGAERVLDALANEFPDAPIVCLWNDDQRRYQTQRVSESWIARTSLRRHKALAIPAMLESWRRLPAVDAEWMLCASHLFAHHARMLRPADSVPKFVFAYTPARYIWSPEADARASSGLYRAVAGPLRVIDRRRAQEAVRIAAVSRFVAQRIERSWGRESTVINPPVDVTSFLESDDGLTDEEQMQLDSLPPEFLLGASRFVVPKRLDLAIAAGVAADLPVVLAGDGPDLERLRTIAAEYPGRVTFVGRPSLGMLRALYRRAIAFVFGPVEDFGIMPVEAMATGTPVVANFIGGSSETVIDGVTGALFRSTDPAELRRAVEIAVEVDSASCRSRALDFDGNSFGARVRDWMGV